MTSSRGFTSMLSYAASCVVQQRASQTMCGLITKNYALLDSNKLAQADTRVHPFIVALHTTYFNPNKEDPLLQSAMRIGSCFPVAPNVILTAKHTVADQELIEDGYRVMNTTLRTSYNTFLGAAELASNFKGEMVEIDPIEEGAWGLSRDYAFMKVHFGVFPQFLLPRIAKEGEKLVFPAPQPSIYPETVASIKESLMFEYMSGGLSVSEARDKVNALGLTKLKLSELVAAGMLVQGEGEVLKSRNGLFAHSAPFFKGMSGTFGTADMATFSGIGISAGFGVVEPGTTYNVAVGLDREDIRVDYESHVLPHLPKECRDVAQRYLCG